ncbi:hypothetical protein [Neobacillus muris]|uniref:hypothetical protein n=1 Tax=Neobacillus muris TaxID=2941334 RepID=UPI00203EDABB|nr:hypothetical protein [Neobacillus muris]
MKRSEFFKEMAGGLIDAIKSAYDPFLLDDLEKVETAADLILGINWVPLMNENEKISNLEMRFLIGKPIIVSKKGTEIRTMSGVCPVCSNIIILTTLYSTGKCLNCQKEINFKTNEGGLRLDPLPIKVKDHRYYVGLQSVKKQGGLHA